MSPDNCLLPGEPERKSVHVVVPVEAIRVASAPQQKLTPAKIAPPVPSATMKGYGKGPYQLVTSIPSTAHAGVPSDPKRWTKVPLEPRGSLHDTRTPPVPSAATTGFNCDFDAVHTGTGGQSGYPFAEYLRK